jgi:hypothetical protein
MEYKGPKFTLNGDIDCEIKHLKFGWIPFTASPVDPAKHGRDIYALIIAEGGVAPFVAPAPVPRYATASAAKSAVTAWIDALTGSLQNQYPAVVQGGWIEEEAIASAFEAGTATEAQLATLQADGAAKNRTPAEHAARILANAASFRAIARATRRLWLATVEKIDLENDPFQYEVIMQAAIEEAAPLAAAYGLT